MNILCRNRERVRPLIISSTRAELKSTKCIYYHIHDEINFHNY